MTYDPDRPWEPWQRWRFNAIYNEYNPDARKPKMPNPFSSSNKQPEATTHMRAGRAYYRSDEASPPIEKHELGI